MVCAEDVIDIYRTLESEGIHVWLSGGWGIDALLREQTRPHKDLDLIMLVDDILRMRDLLGQCGYGMKDLWSENSWVVDARGTEIPTAFVMQDSEGRQVDAHAMRLDDQGNGVPAWVNDEGLLFSPTDLAGRAWSVLLQSAVFPPTCRCCATRAMLFQASNCGICSCYKPGLVSSTPVRALYQTIVRLSRQAGEQTRLTSRST